MAYNSGYWEELESDLRKQLADARAEIERYKMGKVAPADYYSMAEAETELCNEIAALRAEIARLNKNLRLLLCETHLDECEAGLFNSKNPDDEPCLICLMEAAERGE